jgi:hypothetical protein
MQAQVYISTTCAWLCRFAVGKILSDDPEEEKKQKAFKGILNKLTPDNFEKLQQQVRPRPTRSMLCMSTRCAVSEQI